MAEEDHYFLFTTRLGEYESPPGNLASGFLHWCILTIGKYTDSADGLASVVSIPHTDLCMNCIGTFRRSNAAWETKWGKYRQCTTSFPNNILVVVGSAFRHMVSKRCRLYPGFCFALLVLPLYR